MTTHLQLLALYAAFVSTVFAVLLLDEPRAQAVLGLQMCGGFLGAAVLLGWLMYPLPW